MKLFPNKCKDKSEKRIPKLYYPYSIWLTGRGRIVTDYVQCESSTEEYLKTKQSLLKEVNEFVLITVEFG